MAKQVLWSSASYDHNITAGAVEWFTKANTIIANPNFDDATIVGGIWHEVLVKGAKHLKICGIFETLAAGIITVANPGIFAFAYGETFKNSHGIRPPMVGVDVAAADGNKIGGSNRLSVGSRSFDMADFTQNGAKWSLVAVPPPPTRIEAVEPANEPICSVNPAAGEKRSFTIYINEGISQRAGTPQSTQGADTELSDFYKVYVGLYMSAATVTNPDDLTLKGEIAAVLG